MDIAGVDFYLKIEIVHANIIFMGFNVNARKLVATLRKLGKDVNKLTCHTVNDGGCAVYAAIVGSILQKQGFDVAGIVMMMHYRASGKNLDVARPVRQSTNPHKWDANGIVFDHVGLRVRIGEETFYLDSDHVYSEKYMRRRGSLCGYGKMIEGELTVAELVGISRKPYNWNPMFDRRDISKIRELANERLILAR